MENKNKKDNVCGCCAIVFILFIALVLTSITLSV